MSKRTACRLQGRETSRSEINVRRGEPALCPACAVTLENNPSITKVSGLSRGLEIAPPAPVNKKGRPASGAALSSQLI